MEELIKYLETVIDLRQAKKVKHKMSDIIAIVFFATLANAENWSEIWLFADMYQEYLKKYLELANGIPSHDTIERVFAMVSSEFLQKLHVMWSELISNDGEEKVKKLLAIDGKTQRGNRNKNQKPNHIVTAVREDGLSITEELVQEKTNEITAIPNLLKRIEIKNCIVTIDAMGTQTEIAKQIKQQRGDYLLALKGNQKSLFQDVKDYFDDEDFLKKAKYKKTTEKARGAIEVREYWQTDDISWLTQKKDWKGLKSIGITKNTIKKDGKTTIAKRYFISSLPCDIEEFSRGVRGHWIVESFHWHLDVTFREDHNKTLEKQASYNLNIIRKLALSVLKLFNIFKHKVRVCLKTKYCTNSRNAIL